MTIEADLEALTTEELKGYPLQSYAAQLADLLDPLFGESLNTAQRAVDSFPSYTAGVMAMANHAEYNGAEDMARVLRRFGQALARYEATLL